MTEDVLTKVLAAGIIALVAAVIALGKMLTSLKAHHEDLARRVAQVEVIATAAVPQTHCEAVHLRQDEHWRDLHEWRNDVVADLASIKKELELLPDRVAKRMNGGG